MCLLITLRTSHSSGVPTSGQSSCRAAAREPLGKERMQTSSTFSWAKAISLVPFAYYYRTRAYKPADLAYSVAVSWLPPIWLAHRLAELSLVEAVGLFVPGYLCFIAIYEIGYLVNDAWDARKDPNGRQRIDFRVGALYLLTFVAIRAAVWAVVGIRMGWIGDPVWLSCFGALVVAFAQHNLMSSPAYRSASFYQLAALRFLTPIVAIIPPADIPLVLVVATFLYIYFRFLSYLDSKKMLVMLKRKSPSFGLVQVAMLTPFLAFVSLALGTWLMVELTLYFLVIYGLWGLYRQLRGGKKSWDAAA